jgi:hypothetical protein
VTRCIVGHADHRRLRESLTGAWSGSRGFWDHAEEANRVVRAFLERHPLPG